VTGCDVSRDGLDSAWVNREKLGRRGCGVPQWEYACWLGGGVLVHDGDKMCLGEAAVSSTVSSGISVEVPARELLSR
jgi:hypothetical protein